MRIPLFALLTLALCCCSVTRRTLPGRSAREEMLISAATDRAAGKLAAALPPGGGPLFIDGSYVDAPDAKYALAAIRAAVLSRGFRLADERSKAGTVLELRTGALSIDQHKFLIGIPQFSLPFPLAGTLTIPEIAFYAVHDDQGVAEFAGSEFTAADGAPVAAIAPDYGYSHSKKMTVLLFISWSSQDFLDEQDKDPEDR